jgi:hypothetical protein
MSVDTYLLGAPVGRMTMKPVPNSFTKPEVFDHARPPVNPFLGHIPLLSEEA